jgi:RND family efflux transporter MFP subunit
MNVRLRFIFLMVLVGLIVGYWENISNYYDRWTRPAQASEMVQSQETEYYCAMHPNVVRAEPGKCPICGMPLVKRAKTARQALPEGVLSQVQMTPMKVHMGRIATTPVAYQLLSHEIRTVGIVDYDETRRAFIAARIKGRIDKLFVNYTGEMVKKGDPLVWIYSPDLLVAQEELLTSVHSLKEQKDGGEAARDAAQTLVAASRKKLVLWGLTEEQVNQIVERGQPETHVTIFSPMAGIVTEKKVLEGHYVDEGGDLYTVADLGRVWMQVKVFEDQIEGVKIGTAVEVTSTAYSKDVFAGKITFIAYTVDSATRTVSARIEIDNPDLKLKPGMYARAIIRTPAGTVTEAAPGAEAAASQPASAEHTEHAGHATAPAPSEHPAAGTADVARAYLALVTAYAQDKTDDSAVSELEKGATTLAEHGAESIRSSAAALAAQAAQLKGKDLKGQRTVLKTLSARAIELMRANPPAGQSLFVAHCPMAKADWLQTSKTINNPYYGQDMLGCGEITGTLAVGAAVADERFATGYYCPVYPDRLYEKAEMCPLDKFPMRFAKVEKMLAVPASAVVDTGTRKVVYRESSPGTFDMIEVQLGARAGEYFPVLSGVRAGDLVATAGAFLVDAENRLNPAASAQYFGASGGPQGGKPGGGHQH